jgi:RNA-binding protein
MCSKNRMDSKQKQALKAKAHKLKPVVMIGSKGLTESVIEETAVALHAHELIKIKIAGSDRGSRKEMTDILLGACEAEHVQSIGNTVVAYKEREE